MGDEAHACWGCMDTFHIWDELRAEVLIITNKTMGPTMARSQYMLAKLCHEEARLVGQALAAWAQRVLRVGEAHSLKYNTRGHFLEEDLLESVEPSEMEAWPDTSDLDP